MRGRLLLLFLVGIALVNGAELSPVSQKDVAVSVVGPPVVIINFPKNGSYFNNETFRINVTHNAGYLWYNLNNGPNQSFSGFTLLGIEEGNYILNVFGNNTYGVTKDSSVFAVDLDLYRIVYDEFKGMGSTIDFDSMTLEEIQSLNNIVLENADGRIEFNELVNVSDDSIPEDNLTHLDRDVEISFNRIEVNPGALPNFNVESTLILHGLSFSNPRILKDGNVCPALVCKKNYYNGNLSFNVSGFSVYSAEETPVSIIPDQGGGTVKKQEVANFELNRERIQVKLKQGETKREPLEIKNTDNKKLSFEIYGTLSQDLFRFSESEFELDAGESKTIAIDFIALENKIPELYLGEINVKSKETEKSVLTSVEIVSRSALFDVRIDIPEKYLSISPGEEIVAGVSIFSLGREGRVDTEVTYQIKDKEGNLILEEEEIIAVDVETSILREFFIPANAKPGDYIFYVRVKYNGQSGSASRWFEVVDKGESKYFNVLILIGILVVAIIALVIWSYLQRKTNRKRHPRRK